MPTPNALIHETSPYLLQHAHNPVQWQPWGEAAWAQARAENKLVLISIGYSACHWCHVMEHQSFENAEIAEVMNAHFVCIKVDREERPDVDQIYMDAVQLMTGRGGWPLNCFALPDGRPVYGGTYFPPQQWVGVLQQLAQQWRSQPERVVEYGQRLTEAVRAMEEVERAAGDTPYQAEDMHRIYLTWAQHWDSEWGGEDREPKFPMPVNWRWLLQYGHRMGRPEALRHLHLTLRRIAWGGIYDAVGGGWARYSTDKLWLVPHFEKMLYDNGQLVTLYCEAHRQQPSPLYAQVIAETLDWVAREMTHPSGAFYSALDADSEGEEGKFYVWTQKETDNLLGADAPLYHVAYNITAEGNWEHGQNIPFRTSELAELAEDFGISEQTVADTLRRCNALLLQQRATRVRPGLDDKVLTGWNALMLQGYAEAYRTLGKPAYLEAALQNAHFIETEMADGDRLHRSWKDGQARINAYLEDYALLADAYLTLHEVTLDAHWLHRAHAYVQYVHRYFWDAETGMYFFTSSQDPALIARKKDLYDNVIPSGNAVLAHVLQRLALLLDLPEYEVRAAQMLANVRAQVVKHGTAHACWARLYLQRLLPTYEVATLGPDATAASLHLQQHYLPQAIFTGSTTPAEALALLAGRWPQGGQTLYYVCQNRSCQLPVSEHEKALNQLISAK